MGLEIKKNKGNFEEKNKEANEELYDSLEYLRTIIGSSHDGIAVVGEQGKLEFGNDSFLDIGGWSKEEIIGQHFMNIVPEDIKDFILERWQEIENGIFKPYDIKVMTRNGLKYLYVSQARAEIKGKKKYICIIKDITENKRLELSLKDSEAKYRELFENADDIMYTLDAKGFFLTINNAGVKALEATMNEIIGSHVSRWLTPESMIVAGERLNKHISGISMDEIAVYEIVCKNGEHKWAELRTRPIKDGSKIIGIHGIARDITEKKRLEEQLKESESKYKDLFENADDPMFTVDTEGRFLDLNEAGLKMLGCARDELIGSSLSSWMTQESEAIASSAIEKYLIGEPVERPSILEIICKNGEHRWVEAKSRILKNGCRITGIHGIARDITEKRTMERKLIQYHELLKKNEERYKDLFENAYDPMYTLDIHGNFQKINNAGLKVLGGTLEETIGSHISRWLTPEGYKAATERLKNLASDKNVSESIIYELVPKYGEHKWAEIRNRAIKEDGRTIGFHGIARDVTEKKRLEQELLESEARYRDLFENADDPMFTLDASNFFLDLNHAGLKVLGCSKEEVIGTHISKWLTPDSFESAQIAIKKRLLGDPIESPSILELVCKNGGNRWAEVTSRVLRDGGRITGMHGIARDITVKRKLEQQLKEYHEKLEKSYEELKEADRLKTEFISNITHELLTPLTSIRGFAELLNDETVGTINDEQKRSLKIVLRNSDRLTRLIKELLDAAYFEQNKFKLQFGLVSINDIISKSVQDIYPQASDKQIAIIQDIKPLPKIWADEEKITRVFANVLSNAIKFTPQKGTITLTAVDDMDKIKISVTDTGIGIPSDKLLQIFDRFYQVDGSTSRKYGGTGLGLSICKSIIEGHYGSIWAESRGNGSTFHITLPKLLEKKKRSKKTNAKS
ncbi:MAG TPA: PAS domain S-box protein [Candidatus Methanoperedens sp.]